MDSEVIRANISTLMEYFTFEGESVVDLKDDNTDLYDDLLSVEMKIKELYEKSILSDNDLEVIEQIKTNSPVSFIHDQTKKSRITLAKDMDRVCSLLAFYLGEHFTNEGYKSYIIEKYELDKEDELVIDTYMNGNYKLNRKGLHSKK